MIKIRLADERDLPDILLIYNDVIENTTAVYDYLPHTLAMRKEWFQAKGQNGFKVFVAEEDQTILGFSSLGPFRNWAAYKYSVENSIYVHSGYRGKGIGKKLLAPVIEAAREINMHTVIAGIDDTNTASIRLHESFGFTRVAHFLQVGYKFGRWLNLTFLQLILDTPEHPVEK